VTKSLCKYFKKSHEGLLILVQLDPARLTGVELIVDEAGQVVRTDREFDEYIYHDLAVDEFETASPLEFNLYLKGLGC
jgi:hypothetical protein